MYILGQLKGQLNQIIKVGINSSILIELNKLSNKEVYTKIFYQKLKGISHNVILYLSKVKQNKNSILMPDSSKHK